MMISTCIKKNILFFYLYNNNFVGSLQNELPYYQTLLNTARLPRRILDKEQPTSSLLFFKSHQSSNQKISLINLFFYMIYSFTCTYFYSLTFIRPRQVKQFYEKRPIDWPDKSIFAHRFSTLITTRPIIKALFGSRSEYFMFANTIKKNLKSSEIIKNAGSNKKNINKKKSAAAISFLMETFSIRESIETDLLLLQPVLPIRKGKFYNHSVKRELATLIFLYETNTSIFYLVRIINFFFLIIGDIDILPFFYYLTGDSTFFSFYSGQRQTVLDWRFTNTNMDLLQMRYKYILKCIQVQKKKINRTNEWLNHFFVPIVDYSDSHTLDNAINLFDMETNKASSNAGYIFSTNLTRKINRSVENIYTITNKTNIINDFLEKAVIPMHINTVSMQMLNQNTQYIKNDGHFNETIVDLLHIFAGNLASAVSMPVENNNLLQNNNLLSQDKNNLGEKKKNLIYLSIDKIDPLDLNLTNLIYTRSTIYQPFSFFRFIYDDSNLFKQAIIQRRLLQKHPQLYRLGRLQLHKLPKIEQEKISHNIINDNKMNNIILDEKKYLHINYAISIRNIEHQLLVRSNIEQQKKIKKIVYRKIFMLRNITISQVISFFAFRDFLHKIAIFNKIRVNCKPFSLLNNNAVLNATRLAKPFFIFFFLHYTTIYSQQQNIWKEEKKNIPKQKKVFNQFDTQPSLHNFYLQTNFNFLKAKKYNLFSLLKIFHFFIPTNEVSHLRLDKDGTARKINSHPHFNCGFWNKKHKLLNSKEIEPNYDSSHGSKLQQKNEDFFNPQIKLSPYNYYKTVQIDHSIKSRTNKNKLFSFWITPLKIDAINTHAAIFTQFWTFPIQQIKKRLFLFNTFLGILWIFFQKNNLGILRVQKKPILTERFNENKYLELTKVGIGGFQVPANDILSLKNAFFGGVILFTLFYCFLWYLSMHWFKFCILFRLSLLLYMQYTKRLNRLSTISTILEKKNLRWLEDCLENFNKKQLSIYKINNINNFYIDFCLIGPSFTLDNSSFSFGMGFYYFTITQNSHVCLQKYFYPQQKEVPAIIQNSKYSDRYRYFGFILKYNINKKNNNNYLLKSFFTYNKKQLLNKFSRLTVSISRCSKQVYYIPYFYKCEIIWFERCLLFTFIWFFYLFDMQTKKALAHNLYLIKISSFSKYNAVTAILFFFDSFRLMTSRIRVFDYISFLEAKNLHLVIYDVEDRRYLLRFPIRYNNKLIINKTTTQSSCTVPIQPTRLLVEKPIIGNYIPVQKSVSIKLDIIAISHKLYQKKKIFYQKLNVNRLSGFFFIFFSIYLLLHYQLNNLRLTLIIQKVYLFSLLFLNILLTMVWRCGFHQNIIK